MKIYSLLLIKDEIDIISPILISASYWSDKIIVYDNGSTDGTWEKVIELSKQYPNIIPYIQDSRPFHIGLRSILFNNFKHEMTSKDWWCIRMDGDEFYIDNPKEFLKDIPFKYKQVWKESIEYQLTKEDIKEHIFSGSFKEDEKKINYYEKKSWTEIRFLRHNKKLSWSQNQKLPTPKGLTYSKKILVKHFKFRSINQLKKRFNNRQKAITDGCNSFKHEIGTSWEYYLRNRADLVKDSQDGNYHTIGSVKRHIRKRSLFINIILNWFKYYD